MTLSLRCLPNKQFKRKKVNENDYRKGASERRLLFIYNDLVMGAGAWSEAKEKWIAYRVNFNYCFYCTAI